MRRAVVTVATPPASPLVALADVKANLRVAWDDEDATIQGYIDAAVAMIDGPSGRLGRALVSQTWQHVCSGPDCGRVWLTAKPTEISAISYFDTNEDEQSAIAADFRVHTDGYAFAVTPKTGKAWPALAPRSDALTVTYKTGYADAAAVPAPIKQAVQLIVGHWYKEREAVATASLKEMPFAVDTLLENYKIGFVA